MKIYTMPQHRFLGEQTEQTKEIINHWTEMSHTERTAFIDSINVDTNPEWIEIRTGKFTASTASEFLADPVSKADKEAGLIGESAKTLCYKIMAEMTGWREQQNPYLEYASIRRGLVFESIARTLAEKKIGKQITECGFVSENEFFGCSPDGLIMDNDKIEAVVEIKCPEPKAFYKQLMDCAKREYQLQMQFAMNICDCPRAYFVLYCPEINPDIVYVLKYTRGMMWQDKINKRKIAVINYMSEVKKQTETGEINIPTLE